MSPYDGRSEKLLIVNILRDQTGTAFGDRSTPLLDDGDNCDDQLGSLILIRGGPRGPRYCLKLPVREDEAIMVNSRQPLAELVPESL